MVVIDWGNGLFDVRYGSTNADLLSTGPLGAILIEIWKKNANENILEQDVCSVAKILLQFLYVNHTI